MPHSLQEQAWLKEFEPLTDLELRQIAAKPQGAFAASEKTVFAGHVLADRESRNRDKREAETLSIAKEANRIAWVAAISATIAAITAIVAIVISIKS